MQNYRVTSKLGIGSFAKVSLATHIPTNSEVAVKVIQKSTLKNKADICMVNREIAVAKSLNHQNIAKLYEIVQSQDSLCLIMEYLDGGDLLQYVKQNSAIDEHQALQYIQQLLKAVRYLHEEKGIAHRDIKLANVLLCNNNKQVKLADFGLSSFYDKALPVLQTSCGSPCYSAPEVLRAKRYCPLSADIWSLGIVMHCMLEGCLPFFHENVRELCRMVVNGKYPKPQKCSSNVAELLKKVLEVDPYKRISIFDFQQEVKNILDKVDVNSILKINPPKLTSESTDYIENMRKQTIISILKSNGYSNDQISAAFEHRKKYNRAYKFNNLNTFIQLLEKKSFGKLREIASQFDTDKQWKQSRQNTDKKLKRTQSNFTRDTAKSPRGQRKKSNPKFMRNSQLREVKVSTEMMQQKFSKVSKQGGNVQERGILVRKRRTARNAKCVDPQIQNINNQTIKFNNAYIKLKSPQRIIKFKSSRMNLSLEKSTSYASPLSLSLYIPDVLSNEKNANFNQLKSEFLKQRMVKIQKVMTQSLRLK